MAGSESIAAFQSMFNAGARLAVAQGSIDSSSSDPVPSKNASQEAFASMFRAGAILRKV